MEQVDIDAFNLVFVVNSLGLCFTSYLKDI